MRIQPEGCPQEAPESLQRRFREIRRTTLELCAPLEPDDYGIQSMPDVSPPKWHLAHSTWFFETFLLIPHLTDYR
ncbi:MAG TPA: DinB family protein, partial [bacterium]|nr:DinB family protein [bacterium]